MEAELFSNTWVYSGQVPNGLKSSSLEGGPGSRRLHNLVQADFPLGTGDPPDLVAFEIPGADRVV